MKYVPFKSGGGVLTQFPGAGRRHFLRAEFRSNSMVVMGNAAQQSGGIASVRQRQCGEVLCHGDPLQ
jgi:hypothetical protein